VNDLLHFSAKPLTTIRTTTQGARPAYKPRGLWVSVGESWAEWCLAEEFNTGSLCCVSRIQLVDDANVLRLTSAEHLDDFTKRYGVVDPRYADAKYADYTEIDWRVVAQSFDGIVIAPYIYERRMFLMWYYGWDCASGCLWNARAIAAVESIDLAAALPSPDPRER